MCIAFRLPPSDNDVASDGQASPESPFSFRMNTAEASFHAENFPFAGGCEPAHGQHGKLPILPPSAHDRRDNFCIYQAFCLERLTDADAIHRVTFCRVFLDYPALGHKLLIGVNWQSLCIEASGRVHQESVGRPED